MTKLDRRSIPASQANYFISAAEWEAVASGAGVSGTETVLPVFAASGVTDSAISDITATKTVSLADRRLVVTYAGDQLGAHGGIVLLQAGVGITEADGGIQSFNNSTYDATVSGRQSFAYFASNTSSRSAGANELTNYGIYATASGGQNNYAFYGAAGLFQNNGAGAFASSLTVGTTLGVTGACTLGSGADLTTMHGPAIIDGNLSVGAGASAGATPPSVAIGPPNAATNPVGTGNEARLVLFSNGSNTGLLMVNNNLAGLKGWAFNNAENAGNSDLYCYNYSLPGTAYILRGASGNFEQQGNGRITAGQGGVQTSGTSGATWYSGTGAPGAFGSDGDMYSRTDNGGQFYQRRSSAWVEIVS